MNDNPNLRSSATQKKRILAHLLRGGRITSLEALRRYGCMRLASRICDLRKTHPEIASMMITLSNGKRVKQYFIDNKKEK